jgi:hypothetical protein
LLVAAWPVACGFAVEVCAKKSAASAASVESCCTRANAWV